MDIAPFGVEPWMIAHENHCELNLAETCVDSLTVDELLALGVELTDMMQADVARTYERIIACGGRILGRGR